jgi:hypothetical protein
MKKTLFLPIFFLIALSSFALDIPVTRIFIEGTASRRDHQEYFLTNFKMEAVGTGYIAAEKKEDAQFTFNFNVEPIENPEDNNRYVIRISLIRNEDDFEILFFDFYFATLEEMYDYNQSLFLRAVSYIPPIDEDELALLAQSLTDDTWRNKWIYLRASFDYPVSFYFLQPDGLVGGAAVYNGDPSDTSTLRVSPLDHKIYALPGATVGVEFQFFKYMSLELNVQFSLGGLRDTYFIGIAAQADLRFPLKFLKNFVLAPYLSFNMPLNKSSEFYNFPSYGIGGGMQIGVRGGRSGSFFIDVSYRYFLGNASAFNFNGELFPNPRLIYYQRSVLGLGIGYKFGFINRR